MSNYNQQESENNITAIGRIEVKHRPPSFEVQKGNNAQVGYIHKILDKLVKDLNDGFVPRLDGALNNNKESISKLNVNLETEKGKLNELIQEVGNSDKGLIKDLNDLKEEVRKLKSGTSGDEDINIDEGEWHTPQVRGTDTEFIVI